jgi:hypothetical protein
VKRPEVEKLDKILEKFAPPENCEYLVVPKVNEELWYDLNKFHRSNDLAMQNIQKYLIGGVSAVTSVLNDVIGKIILLSTLKRGMKIYFMHSRCWVIVL